MSLIDCPACTSPVSAAAVACPKCAHPIAQQLQTAPVTIEQTTKRYKVFQLVGGGLIVLAILLLMAGNGRGPGIYAGGIGIAVYLYGKMGAWWRNG